MNNTLNKLKSKSFFKGLLIGIPVVSLLIFALIGYLISSYSKPTGDGQTKFDLAIEEGEGSGSIAKELRKNNMIRSSKYFLFLLKINGNTNKIKHGIYELNNGQSASEIMNLLVSGKVKMLSFTIPEGYHNRQIAELLFNKKLIESKDDFFRVAEDKELINKYKIPAKSVEGYLFPETYVMPVDYKIEKIVEMMLKRFYKNLSTISESKDVLPEELHKKVIMASIVEREAKKKEEQPLMAGVFEKRLKINMPFESCATVQYLFEKPKKRLLEKDLLIESDYNTYLHKGYPPGPISNPGLPAIKAAFTPVESDNLFFLVKPDGSHYFSKTHNEHLEAKKKYIDVLYQ